MWSCGMGRTCNSDGQKPSAVWLKKRKKAIHQWMAWTRIERVGPAYTKYRIQRTGPSTTEPTWEFYWRRIYEQLLIRILLNQKRARTIIHLTRRFRAPGWMCYTEEIRLVHRWMDYSSQSVKIKSYNNQWHSSGPSRTGVSDLRILWEPIWCRCGHPPPSRYETGVWLEHIAVFRTEFSTVRLQWGSLKNLRSIQPRIGL
jgi:hypothetical protein